jgi:hypothetical protein
MKLFVMFGSYMTYLCENIRLTCAYNYVPYLTEDAAHVHCKGEQTNDVSCYCESHKEPTNIQCGKTRSLLIFRHVAYVVTSGP